MAGLCRAPESGVFELPCRYAALGGDIASGLERRTRRSEFPRMHRPKRLSAVTRIAPLVFGLAGASSELGGQTPAPNATRRPMTVADIVNMTTFGSRPHGWLPEDLDVPSPDGRLHAVVVKRGDVERNTNVFSLLVFKSEELFARPKSDTVFTLASSSNRSAIGHLRWLADSRTLVFLGEHPGELPQVYTLDLGARRITP